QQVIVEIQVPVGKQIRFDETVQEKLHPTYYNMRGNGRWNNNEWDQDWNDHNYERGNFEWTPNVDYTMTESGSLVDLAHPEIPKKSDVYEYNDSVNQKLDSQEQQIQHQ